MYDAIYQSLCKKLNNIFHGRHSKIVFCLDTGHSAYHLVPEYKIKTLYRGTGTVPQF